MRNFYCLLLALVVAMPLWAIPADPQPATVVQSDGSTLTLRLVGDEFFHYYTTEDGYTVLKNNAGSYEYAIKNNGELMLSGMLAHDAERRTPAEWQQLRLVGKHAISQSAVSRGKLSRARINGPENREPIIDYASFRGLIVLINYEDKQFGMNNPFSFYNAMVNQRNYSSFSFQGRTYNCTGSMRDYFYDQSGGVFDPQFDIVGPVTVPYDCTDHGGTSNSWRIFWAALDAVDDQVDFSNYDNDGDGFVDMVYFLVAGYSANYSGNNGNYLWPHKSTLYDYENREWISYDNTYIGTYASSCEVYGWESQNFPLPLGIGTMCHEFGHVLGLPDLYDTDYGTSGQSHDPGAWDVMASGGSSNYGRTPCAYSIWERYTLGWNNPQVITGPGQYSLNYVGETGDGLILRTPVSKEFFILDNRQKTKWDYYLPGHGMLIARVDSTNTEAWSRNRVNADPSHNYYELVRAGQGTSGADASDPFPGTMNVTEINNLTNPNLNTWAGIENELGLSNIREVNGVITFTVRPAPMPESVIEDFESMAATTDKNLKNVQGRFAKWNFQNANVTAPTSGLCDGRQGVAMLKPSILAMATPLVVKAFRMEFTAYNSSSTDAKFTVFSSVDGTTWKKLNNQYFEAPANSTTPFLLNVSMEQPLYYRITMAGGSDKQPCYIDNVKFSYSDRFTLGDVNGDGNVDVADVNAVINMMMGKQQQTVSGDVNGDGKVDIQDVNAVINYMLGRQ